MSPWTESWRDFARTTSYKHALADEKIFDDQFWRSYAVYDRFLSYSGYPGRSYTGSPPLSLQDLGSGRVAGKGWRTVGNICHKRRSALFDSLILTD